MSEVLKQITLSVCPTEMLRNMASHKYQSFQFAIDVYSLRMFLARSMVVSIIKAGCDRISKTFDGTIHVSLVQCIHSSVYLCIQSSRCISHHRPKYILRPIDGVLSIEWCVICILHIDEPSRQVVCVFIFSGAYIGPKPFNYYIYARWNRLYLP